MAGALNVFAFTFTICCKGIAEQNADLERLLAQVQVWQGASRQVLSMSLPSPSRHVEKAMPSRMQTWRG